MSNSVRGEYGREGASHLNFTLISSMLDNAGSDFKFVDFTLEPHLISPHFISSRCHK